jgi:shikimate 5-dehydrogenase
MAEILFLGVTTASSLVHQAMPFWQAVLGLPCSVRGVDIAIDADDKAYVRFLEDLRRDKGADGVIVTAHKVKMFRACRALFSYLDPLAVTCQEVNTIRRCDEGLLGWARDPISVGRVVDRIWPEANGHVICLGAGGTALALAQHFSTKPASARFICADPSARAVDKLTRMASYPVTGHIGEGPWDDLVSDAAPGSLIVNATGMGKDRPGSPITGRTRFPPGAVVWELNYRGKLDFLEQARLQASPLQLEVHDGWQLFCHGWAAGLNAMLSLPDDDKLGDRFAAAVHSLRPRFACGPFPTVS